MHKHAHHPHKQTPNGSLDQAAVQDNVASYLEAMKAGKVQVLAVGEPVPIPGMDGVSAKTFIVKE